MAVRNSVIIVSYNCRGDLAGCLDSLAAAPGDFEVIVVDNASTDGTDQLLSSRPEVRAVRNTANHGFSKACNQGAAIAQGANLVFLNPDTFVTRGWLEAMEPYLGLAGVGAVGPTSNYVAGLQKYDLYTRERISRPEEREQLAAALVANHGQGVKTKLLIGFCLMIRASLFRELGGMDEDLFLGNDDLDLSWRITLRGQSLVVATDTFVYHQGQKSFQTEPGEKTKRLVQESSDALYRKLVRHYGAPDQVPGPLELWNMNWFAPSAEVLSEMAAWATSKPLPPVTPARQVPLGPQDLAAPVSLLIYAGSGLADPVLALERTLDSVPARRREDVIILNHGLALPARTLASFGGTKLDLPSGAALGRVLETGLRLAAENVLLFPAGALLSGEAWNNLLDGRGVLPSAPVRLPAQAGAAHPFPAVSGPRDALLALVGKGGPPPPAAFGGLPVENSLPTPEYEGAEPAAPGVAEAASLADKLPASFGSHLATARSTVMCDSHFSPVLTPAATPGAADHADLVLVRVLPEHLEDLGARLRAARPRFAGAKKMVLFLVSGGEAHDDAALPALPEAQKLRNGAWRAGFAVEETGRYSGVPGDSARGVQVVCRPRPVKPDLDKLVSIVILGWNQLDYTRQCIESIRAHTRQRFEFILVDNGSTDQTLEFFRSVPGAQVIHNDENLGVSRGWNQGMKLAKGDYILIFNNDTIVVPGWLENLVRLAEACPRAGIVGPRSNVISGPQLIPDAPVKTLADIQPFGAKWRKEHDLSAWEFERITGFCMLIPRQVFERVGYFDERYGKGNFEDDDYCLRARYLGYTLLVADDSFVFHFGSASFRNEGVDWNAQMRENMAKFQEKWSRGAAAVTDTRHSQEGAAPRLVREGLAAYERQDLARARQLLLEASEIDPALPGVYNGLGILAFHDRNLQDAQLLFQRALELDPADPDVPRNLVDVLDAIGSPEGTVQSLQTLLLRFPRNAQLAAELERRTADAEGRTEHWREYAEELIGARRYPEALDVLEGVLRSGNHQAFCYNYLGIISFQCGDAKMAHEHFRRSLEANLFDEDVLINYCDAGITADRKSDVLGMLARVFSYGAQTAGMGELRQYYDQLRLEAEGGSWDPAKIIASREGNQAGENLIREGLMEKARARFGEVLAADPQSFRAHNNLGLVAWYANQAQEAWDHFRRALDLNPTYDDALVNAFDAALRLRGMDDFRPYLDRALAAEPQHAAGVELLALIRRRGTAIYEIKSFDAADPAHDLVQKGDAAYTAGRLDEATLAYLDAVEKRPECHDAFNGLGLVAHRRGMFYEAYRLFSTAAEISPLRQDCLMNLWEVARQVGREAEAIERLRAALQMDPNLTDVKGVVDSFR